MHMISIKLQKKKIIYLSKLNNFMAIAFLKPTEEEEEEEEESEEED